MNQAVTVTVSTDSGRVVLSVATGGDHGFAIRLDAQEAEQMAAQLHAAAQAVR